ncbi:GNAT family N-acetyltransferase [Dysgonomonas sp. 216]|uniref:GNAT family N-acetyltransferase n=1 Tax=Dysgonomonas sp. 216 TaxID=2302934 RepID=UPI0013D5B901|nr:GNAT family N-acetyltransferase [Dysgonomonas sp. 216]NDW17702.1 GNAT family N-acetyltransferase [Dysgonomonas sp. 216]
MLIKQYTAEDKALWDNFVLSSKNGTFLFCRDFMEYHSDRFKDHSLMFYSKDKLIAILPANISDDIFYSHQGLTYGGLVLSHHIKTDDILNIFSLLTAYLKNIGIKSFYYKAIPHIYHNYPAEEDLYALFRNGASLSSRTVSSTIELANKQPYGQSRKKQVKKASGFKLQILENSSLDGFWHVLDENLRIRYNAKPVHSLAEIQYLKSKFPDNIKLFTVSENTEIIAGSLIFETNSVAHIQYISANERGKQIGALDLLFDTLINRYFSDKRYFDFGISTENGGLYLNSGLIFQKEGFGARAIVYDTYLIDIK